MKILLFLSALILLIGVLCALKAAQDEDNRNGYT